MCEAQKFEILRVPRMRPFQKKILWGALVYFICLPLLDWIRNGFTWAGAVTLGLVGLMLLERWWMSRRSPRFLEIAEAEVSGPLGWSTSVTIPLHQVEDVSITTEGLIIAWKENGVPRYTEVPEAWFAETEWAKAQPALLTWGNQLLKVPALSNF